MAIVEACMDDLDSSDRALVRERLDGAYKPLPRNFCCWSLVRQSHASQSRRLKFYLWQPVGGQSQAQLLRRLLPEYSQSKLIIFSPACIRQAYRMGVVCTLRTGSREKSDS